MATIESRLNALEQAHRNTAPTLLLFYQAEQGSRPTEEQTTQIEQAERTGREIRVIEFVRAEDAFPGFTGLPPER